MMSADLDFYTYAHKGLRKGLLEFLVDASAADFSDRETASSFEARFELLVRRLEDHARHEETFLHPLLAKYVPELEQQLTAGHRKQEGWLSVIATSFRAAVAQTSPALASPALRDFASFIGYYLVHLGVEEEANPQIQGRVPSVELAHAMAQFRASRPLDMVTADLEAMLPALNRQDRLALLGKSKATSPEVLAFVLAIAERVLAPDAFAQLRADLG